LRLSQIRHTARFTSNAGDCSDRLLRLFGPITLPVDQAIFQYTSNTHTDYPDCSPHIVQYTSNTRPTNGLTLLFRYPRSVAPMGFMAEQAGGMATRGGLALQRVVEVTPEHIHQRSPMFVGSKSMVVGLQRFLAKKAEA
jgi:hypothetical protein